MACGRGDELDICPDLGSYEIEQKLDDFHLAVYAKEKLCVKCGCDGVAVYKIDNPMCQSCFVSYMLHKFRSSFGKSRDVHNGEKILFNFTGDANSTVALQLFVEINSNVKKRLRFSPIFIFIEEGPINNLSLEERKGRFLSIEKHFLTLKLDVIMLSLPQIIAFKDISGIHNITIDTLFAYDDILNNLNKVCQTKTSLKHVVDILAKKALLKVAKLYDCTKVLMSDSADDLAGSILSSVLNGRGEHVGLLSSFLDKLEDSCAIIRPLREFLTEDLMFYLKLCKVPIVFEVSQDNGNSLDSLSRTFIKNLPSSNSSVSTILKTAAKLDSKQGSLLCHSCLYPLDTEVPLSSALNATKLSEKISMKQLPESNQEMLCYSCQINYKDCNVAELQKNSILKPYLLLEDLQ